MSKPYESIPVQGEHFGEVHEKFSNLNVRAQDPPDLESSKRKPVQRTYQLLHHREKGIYRLRSWVTEEIYLTEDDYEEVGRYAGETDLTAAFEELPLKPSFVVFENSKTGEVFYDTKSNITAGWPGFGNYDQVTLFDDETKAAEYVQRREKEIQKGK